MPAVHLRLLTAAQQISYERTSQAQNLTRPPILLSAAGYVVFAGWRFKLFEKEL
ncbi:hypothetical protein BH24ACI1_BH24ACI1_25380 [soil metagenome]